jgi:uncharacterized protein (TIGR03086 family)
MNFRTALTAVLDAQVAVGNSVQGSQLSVASACRDWSVGEVMNHSIAVTTKFTQFALGATDRPHDPAGDLLGSDHRSALRSSTQAAKGAWAAADPTRLCHLSFGVFHAEHIAGINLFDALAHTWDIAVPFAIPIRISEEAWIVALEAARQTIGAERDLNQYQPELLIDEHASPDERFLAFLGRSAASSP